MLCATVSVLSPTAGGEHGVITHINNTSYNNNSNGAIYENNTCEDDDRTTILASDIYGDGDNETCSTITDDGNDACEVTEGMDFIDPAIDGAAHDSQRVTSQRMMSSPQSQRRASLPEKPNAAPPIHRARRTILSLAPRAHHVVDSVFPALQVRWESLKDTSNSASLLLSASCEGRPTRLTCVYEMRRGCVPSSMRREQFALSRLHCEVRLHFRLCDGPDRTYKWTSFDVVDCSSSNGTFYGPVRLFPLHRYSFKVSETGECVVLQLGQQFKWTMRMANDALVGDAPIPPKVAAVDAAVQWNAPIVRSDSLPIQPPSPARTKSTITAPSKPRSRATSSGNARGKSIKIITEPTHPKATTAAGTRKRAQGTSTGEETTVTHAAPLTIVTTGISLTSRQMAKCRRLNIKVNPNPCEYVHATHLVIGGPLMRSVKLLTALPYVRYVVDRAWLDAILSSNTTSSASSSSTAVAAHLLHAPADAFRYTEHRTAQSIESVNDFSIHSLLDTPLEHRRTLLSGDVVWVHPDTVPQEPPGNDLRAVIIASGGALTAELTNATIALMPRRNPTAAMWRRALGWGSCAAHCLFIVPDDLFRGVLQQRRPMVSTVDRYVAEETARVVIKRRPSASPEKRLRKRSRK